mgnify:CR=1 FL=1
MQFVTAINKYVTWQGTQIVNVMLGLQNTFTKRASDSMCSAAVLPDLVWLGQKQIV